MNDSHLSRTQWSLTQKREKRECATTTERKSLFSFEGGERGEERREKNKSYLYEVPRTCTKYQVYECVCGSIPLDHSDRKLVVAVMMGTPCMYREYL